MKLFTYVATEIGDDLLLISFHDPELQYGVSLTLMKDDPELEIMVADQSCFRSSSLKVDLDRHRLDVVFPKGTIDPSDGDDEYEIHFRIENEEFVKLTDALKRLLKGRGTLNIRCPD